MSKHYISDISKQKLTRQKPSEALRKGFAEAVKAAVEEHRAAGRSLHEAAVKQRGKR